MLALAAFQLDGAVRRVEKLLTVKGALICNIVDQKYAHGASVVCSCDRPEALLPGCVPYLQFYTLAVQFDGANFEVYSYGCDEGGCEGVFAEAEETARFADA